MHTDFLKSRSNPTKCIVFSLLVPIITCLLLFSMGAGSFTIKMHHHQFIKDIKHNYQKLQDVKAILK